MAASTDSANVTVLGAGSWGTALAIHLERRGHRVRLWTRTQVHARALEEDRENQRYLPGHFFGQGLTTHHRIEEALAAADLVVVAIPSHGLRAAIASVADQLRGDGPNLLIAAKGVEVESLATMAEVATQELGDDAAGRVTVLGGPSFAAEVAAGKPTAVVVGGSDDTVTAWIQRVLSGQRLRAYVTEDVIGVELGGAFKNVIAIAAGMCDGAGLGLNARAGLITRGLAEISRLAIARGAIPATLSGLAGLGDLVLTCTGGLSRNRRVGIALGEGRKLENIVAELGMVAEGVRNTLSAYQLAQREGVEMPITETMHAILYENLTVSAAVEQLMSRALKAERA
jgi:glycerol-3-phosphate dehydrogenase (NAD(P)+)